MDISRAFKVSRNTIYKWRKKELEMLKQHEIIKYLVHEVRAYMPRLGGEKLHYILEADLKTYGIKIGRDKFCNTLRQLCLLVPKKKKFVRTTNSNHLFNKRSNLVKGMKIDKPEKLWVSDITYIKTSEGKLYLSLITDAYSKKIVGYNLSDNLKAESSVKALMMAIKNRLFPKRRLIHHSDRGIQYCCPEYTDVLDFYKIKISMTQQYDPYENSIAERINGILKQEFDISSNRMTKNDAYSIIARSIKIYNSMRPHFSCNLMTPNQAHLKGKFEYKKWGNFCINEIWK